MRGFIAVPIENRDKFSSLIESVRYSYSRTSKPVSMDQIHVTLKFFGDIPDKTSTEISSIIDQFDFPKFRLRAESVGQFPGKGLANVLYVKVFSPDIYQLEKKVCDELSSLSIEMEKKPFIPHITISRFRKPTDLRSTIIRFENEKFTDETSERLIFFKSELNSSGPHYEVIGNAQLK
ncbi:MAG: RNA 2',3'-cyclic phosphodiesterase [Thermoplasmataceae archaeon]